MGDKFSCGGGSVVFEAIRLGFINQICCLLVEYINFSVKDALFP
jgi:hypothetical protein